MAPPHQPETWEATRGFTYEFRVTLPTRSTPTFRSDPGVEVLLLWRVCVRSESGG